MTTKARIYGVEFANLSVYGSVLLIWSFLGRNGHDDSDKAPIGWASLCMEWKVEEER
jgi:hypothetical protein